jgi:hypothetical protein
MTLKGFPELKFDTPGNAAISLAVIGEHARRENLKVRNDGIDVTGRLVLRIELPGWKSVVKDRREFKR